MIIWGIRNRYKHGQLNKGGFGDKWAQVSASVNYAIRNNHQYVLFSEYGEKGKKGEIELLDPYNKNVILDIFRQFDMDVRFVFESRTSKRESVKFVKEKYPLVTQKHVPERHNRIGYQMKVENIISPYHKQNGYTEDEYEQFLSWMNEQTHIEFIELGKHMSLEENINILCNSDLFMGIDSGMSHMAHSVDIPMFLQLHRGKLYRGRQLEYFHPNKRYTPTKDINDMIDKVEGYLNT